MRRYRFELESVLRLARLEYKQALAAAGQWIERLDMLRQRGELMRKVVVGEADNAEKSRARGLYEAYRITLLDSMRQNDLEVSQAEARLRECRRVLDAKRSRRDALEKLDERRHAAWRVEFEKHEQRELEELASLRTSAARSAAGRTDR
ncbi:MAG: flagellar FliJ family protein [Planctomycetes bacterium]|nr:flagellar FliJ family protein [Planctomycetota bacterium]